MRRPLIVLIPLLVAVTAVVAATPSPTHADASVQLHPGWNNFAYDGETLLMERALGEIAADVVAVWHWEAEAASWTNYFRAAPSIATLTALVTGEVYWLRAERALVWQQSADVLFQSALVEVVNAAGVSFVLRVDLADTTARRARGLMFRPTLADDEGMLFLFPSPTTNAFWMRNTFVPLSIAFIDGDGVIIDVQDMEPLTTTLHAPGGAYRWALEAPQGWFGARALEPGATVRLIGA